MLIFGKMISGGISTERLCLQNLFHVMASADGKSDRCSLQILVDIRQLSVAVSLLLKFPVF